MELVKRLNFNNRVFCVCIEAVIEVHIVHFELQLGKKASRSHVLKMHNKLLVEKWALLLATAYLDTKRKLRQIFLYFLGGQQCLGNINFLRNACLIGEAYLKLECSTVHSTHCPIFTAN